MSRRLGLIIGINQYEDSAFSPLRYAENDARALAQWLVNTKGGKWAPTDVQFVQGAHVTRELIESQISQLCLQMAGPNDLAVIYFAGHAYVDERSGEGYLALANTHHGQPASGLHLGSLLQQVLARSRAAQILCIFDCYQSSPTWSRMRSFSSDFRPLISPSVQSALQQGNRLLLCTCRGNDLLPETGERNLGLFIYQAIVGLCGSANPAAPAEISLQQLTNYLSSMLGEQHRPQLFGQERTPFQLVGDLSSSSPLQQLSPTTSVRQNGVAASENPYATQLASFAPSATATAPQRQSTSSSGKQLASAVKQHVQQQCKAMLAQAQQQMQAQNHTEALNIVEQVLNMQPDDPEALVLKSQILGTMGRTPEALSTTERLLQVDPQNALAWSMHAVLLTNMGQYQAALSDIERSLELDSSNMESYSIKNSIMANMAAVQTRSGALPANSFTREKSQGDNARAFLLGAGIQLGGLLLGAAGAVLPIFVAQLPALAALALESFGLSILTVNAARGAYRYGASRLMLTIIFSLLTGVILAGISTAGYKKIMAELNVHPTLLIPIAFLAGWLALATIVPFVAAVGGLAVGFVKRKR